MRVAEDQRCFVVREINGRKIFKQVFTVTYPHIISFRKHERDTDTEIYIKPSQISMMEFFTNNN